MIALDTNLLIYAHRAESHWHDLARERIRALAEGRDLWAIPWPCIHEFLAIATHPKIYNPPTPPEAALAQIGIWCEAPSLALIGETPQHLEHLESISLKGRITGPRFHDARIAAICLQHGVSELWSADRDFSRFPALKVRNPLID